jgi:lipopolysaccharide/colanic/teichoic acid biosynthesis glycosyltransferase
MKRAFDIFVSLLGLIVLAPFLAVLVGFQWFKLGRPLFFRQVRAGRGGRPFEIIKVSQHALAPAAMLTYHRLGSFSALHQPG